jgi:signal transduction histidine kinase
MPAASSTVEQRAFGVHPEILLTLMREQAGSLAKALSELVMNSIDAGATAVHLSIDKRGFTIADNGNGFSDRGQIENFFEKFGTPHEEGDAYFGRFRIGRGQIMSYAKTTWRSGPFEMKVDIAAADQKNLGYELVTHHEKAVGCQVAGVFYKPFVCEDEAMGGYDYWQDSFLSELDEFSFFIKYASIPIFLNNEQINTVPSTAKWTMEDENAWYLLERTDGYHSLSFFNRGIFVEKKKVTSYGVSGVVVSKLPLKVNLARNAILSGKCDVSSAIDKAIHARFMFNIRKAKKLNLTEAHRLLSEILSRETPLLYEDKEKIRKIRFIPDIFGELRSPEDFLSGSKYTYFLGEHRMIAERVQRQKRAAVIMPDMFNLEETRLNGVKNLHPYYLISTLRSKLGLGHDIDWIDFDEFVEELYDTHAIIDDKDLCPEELLVLHILRDLDKRNTLLCRFYKEPKRQLFAGQSDNMDAWTDGKTYIAIDRRELLGIRGKSFSQSGSALKLLALLTHEYCHSEQSTGEHAHDHAFYQRFHEMVLSDSYNDSVNIIFRRYVAALCKAQIVPSGDVGYHIRKLADLATKLKPRKICDRKEPE